MATTINSGYANSPKLTANIADHADVYGGRALVFDGATDYLDCGDLTSTTRSNMTISFWFYRGASGTVHICSRDDEGSNRNWSMYIYDNLINFDFLISNSGKNTVGATAIPVSSWTHLAFTHNGSNQAWYVNGKLDGTSSHSGAIDNDSVNMYIGRRANNYLNGKISDFKVFDTALTEAQVQELYKKPENTPSAVQDNLVAWYPMIEGNPESPQSIVYDHSEKKLGSDFARAVTADNWNAYANMTVNTITGGISIVAPTTASGVSVSSNGAYIYFRGGTFSGENQLITKDLTVGKTYCVTFNAFYSGGASGVYADINNGSSVSVFSDAFTTTNKSYKMYFSAGTATTALIRFQQIKLDNTVYITDISVKEVLMGNHATTNFFGDEAIANTSFDDTSNWTAGNSATISSESGGQSGNYLKVLTGGENNPAARSVATTVIASTNYKLSFYYKDTGSSGDTPTFSIFDVSNNSYIASGTSVTSAISSSSWVLEEYEFSTPSGCTSLKVFLTHSGTSGDNSFSGFDTVSLKQVGVSSSGFETAVNEPVVPQVPLMRYNEKAIFYRNKNNYVSLTEQTLGANTAFTISFSFTPFADQEHHMIGKNSLDDTIRIDTAPAYGSRVHVRINGTGLTHFTGLGNININESAFYTITRTTGGVFSVYRNGVKSSTSVTDTSDFKYQYLGQSLNGTWESDGLLDEFSIFNTHFSDAEAQELFNDGVALDATTHSKKGNLLGYWRNDGVTTWQDRRGWSFLDFDGSSDEVTLDSELTFTGVFSVSFWVKYNSSGAEYVLGKVGGDQDYFYAHPTHPRWRINDNIISSNSDMAVNVWHHVLGVRDSSDNFIWYLNGSLATVYNGSSYVTTGITKSGDFDVQYFGRSLNTYGEIELTNVAFFNTDKSSSASTFYNNGLAYDYTTESGITNYYKMDSSSTLLDRVGSVNGTVDATLNDGNDGTVQGSPDSITIREGLNSNRDGLGFYFTNPSSNVLRLPTVNEYLLIKDSDVFSFGDGSGDLPFSISAWIKMEEATQFVIVSKGVYNSNFEYIFWVNDNDKLSLELYDESVSSTYEGAYYNSALNQNEWIHVCATYDGRGGTSANAGIKLYINGDSKTTTTFDGGTYVSMENLGADLHIGKYTTYTGTGIMDEFMIYNKELSATEVSKNYKHGKGKHKND